MDPSRRKRLFESQARIARQDLREINWAIRQTKQAPSHKPENMERLQDRRTATIALIRQAEEEITKS
jgi:hypothetical protein